VAAIAVGLFSLPVEAQVRARAAGVPLLGTPGPLNAITDVSGVEVGQTTLVSGSGLLVPGHGPVRTGVTVIFPKGRAYLGSVYAGSFVLNGTGELTGRSLIEELGEFFGPVALTGTGSVGTVRDAVQAWYRRRLGGDPERLFPFSLPVVGETFDGTLNDVFGGHVHPEHVFAALDGARPGPVEEGNVGGGTGMTAHGFKAGIGTSSRVVAVGGERYTVGVLVQANHGSRDQLTIAGVPVGRELRDPAPTGRAKEGSIVVVVATDAPLLPHQLRRVAVRATHGMARVGGMSGTTSGDIFLAFSTARPTGEDAAAHQVTYLDSLALNPLFEATVLATEEAILNALFTAKTMSGINGTTVAAIPVERVQEILKKYGRLADR
jgi:L-aminopeptidase/D-esterase-like protein